MKKVILFFILWCLLAPAFAQEKPQHHVLAKVQFRKLYSSDHVGVNVGYVFKGRHELNYGIYYLLQDAVFWDNNQILVKTYRPDKLYQHFNWSLGYFYNLHTFPNGSGLALGLDIQQMRSQAQSRAVVPELSSGKLIEADYSRWFSLMEAHLVARCTFPIHKQVAFSFQGGLGGLFQPDWSPPKNLLTQFVPFWAPHWQGASYHLAFSLQYQFKRKP